MEKRKKEMSAAYVLFLAAIEGLHDVWRRIWNKRIKLWWYRLWIRKNEFHRSLDNDLEALYVMTPQERSAYQRDLVRRRGIAHERDLARMERRQRKDETIVFKK
jgi:hypothetical protein